ncbi:hypothetical protein BXZ70DRAFT_684987 [Cristinia sonorae]|uniref:BTB domain-containing protein n=1 Tax=Cristinia sonorae TaxID=1940300 RepID=A0A8K0UWA3_9AGAR|nr:hypothetical protein BXZ70DRAFT_684987 [Cristinia sonorae]
MSYSSPQQAYKAESIDTTHYRPFSHAAFPFDRTDADLILRSTDLIDFRVHRAILEMSSSFFANPSDVLDSCSGGMSSAEEGGLPICHINATGHILDLLLRHPYPVPTPDVDDMDAAYALLRVSREYGFALVVDGLKRTILRFAEANPLKAYARAAMLGCKEEMQLAARISLRYPILEEYVPELEELSAGIYHRLLSYHRLCGRVAAAVVDDMEWAALHDGSPAPAWLTCHLCPSFKVGAFPKSKDRDLCATSWFHTLVLTLKQGLRARPCGSTLFNSELSETSLTEAMACPVCHDTAAAECRRLILLLKEEVNHAISKIRLHII